MRTSFRLLSVAFLLNCLVSAVSANVTVPGYRAKATSDARQVGIALKMYADEHDGKLPASLAALTPDYLPDSRLQEHMRITTPNLILRDLPEDCIIAIRTVPEDARYVVAVHSTIATIALKLSPTASNWEPADTRRWPLIPILGGISGWLIALALWIKRTKLA